MVALTRRSLLAGSALLLGAGPGLARSFEPVKITVVQASTGFPTMPLFAMREVGPEFNFQITELIGTPGGGSEAGSIFASGTGDVLAAAFDKVIALRAAGLVEAKTFAAMMPTAGWALVTRSDSPFKTVADLKGQTIGTTSSGNSSDMLLRWALKKNGLNPDRDVTIVGLGTQVSMQAAIMNGKVVATLQGEPFVEASLKDGSLRLLDDWRSLPMGGNVFSARVTDLKSKPEVFIRFYSVLRETLRRFRDDRPFGIAMAKKFLPNMSEADINSQLDLHIAKFWAPMDGRMTQAMYDSSREIFIDAGRFKPEEIGPMSDLVVNLEPEF